MRPRRSVLYMPGANARALQKAKDLPADGLILDLEDAVAPNAKPVARAQVCAAVEAGGYGWRELVIRVNGLDTPWGLDDVKAASATSADAILLPKVESAAMVERLDKALRDNGARADMAIWCMIETPLGILRAAEIAAALPRMRVLVMGTSDLTKDLQARHRPDRLPMITALSLCLLAARAHGRVILDGVRLDLDDTAGFDAACQQGVDLGFDGKTLIHPKQIDPCNKIFAPGENEIAEARKIVAAFETAEAAGQGVVLVDGKLIENLHVEAARRTLSFAEMIAERT